MESSGCSNLDRNHLVNELKQGRELAKQLQVHLDEPFSSDETRQALVHEILSSFGKALSLLKSSGTGTGRMPKSPRSFSGSPPSEDSDREFHDPELKDAHKKRKSMQRRTQHVRITPGIGVEGLLVDGYSWRKYGQKDILGARHPRGYYRCTYRPLQGCLATKQVQRSDDDPTLFEITYRGTHTCNSSALSSPPPLPFPEKREDADPSPEDRRHHWPEKIWNFEADLQHITEKLDSPTGQPLHLSHIPSSSINYASSVMHEAGFPGDFASPSFARTISGSNYPPAPQTEANSKTFLATEPLGEMIPADTFPLDQFDPPFCFDYQSFFS